MRALVSSAAAAALLLTAGAARAQSLELDATGLASGQIIRDTKVVPAGFGYTFYNKGGEGGSVEAVYTISSSTINFESGVVASGGFAEATSYSGVDVTIFNASDGLLAIDDFGSTITAAGMGFYLQNRRPLSPNEIGTNIFTDSGQTIEMFGLSDLDPTVGSEIAFSDFEFSIVSNDVTLYTLSGSMSLSLDGEGNLQRNFNLDAASSILKGFVNTGHDQNISWAYAWDATDIIVPLNTLLETGQSQVLQYRTRVTSRTRAECLSRRTCLAAFAGFGDPIGRGGGISAFDSVEGDEFSAFSFRGFNSFGPAAINGIVFDPQEVTPFQAIDNGGGLVPEPSTWAMVIMGFGMLGAALRRRRALSYS